LFLSFALLCGILFLIFQWLLGAGPLGPRLFLEPGPRPLGPLGQPRVNRRVSQSVARACSTDEFVTRAPRRARAPAPLAPSSSFAGNFAPKTAETAEQDISLAR
jgi:hypothetical protein